MAVIAKFHGGNSEISGFANVDYTLGVQATQNGVTWNNIVAFVGKNFSGVYPADSPVYSTFPRSVLNRNLIVGADPGHEIRFEGLSPNTTYKFTYLGASPEADRSINISDGIANVDYINASDPTTTVEPPVSIESESDASGNITHFITRNSVTFANASLTGVVVEDVGPSLTITNPIIPGASTTISTSGDESPWTGARITDSDGNIKELTLESQTSVSAPALATQAYVLFGDVTLEVYNATESATTTVAFNPPASHQYLVTLPTTPSNLTNTGYLFDWSPTNGYEGAQVIATVPIDENGNILETAVTGEQTFYSIDDFDGAMQSFPVTIQDGQIVNVGRITRRNLTRRTLTRRSLTARP